MIVDMPRLRDFARHGVPEEVRGDVWRLLLGVSQPDRSEEAGAARRMDQHYQTLDKNHAEALRSMRADAAQYERRSRMSGRPVALLGREERERVERAVCAHFSDTRSLYVPGTLSLVLPLAECLKKEFELFHALQRLMAIVDDTFSAQNLTRRVAHFMMLFRSLLPELYNHFDEEEVKPHEWAVSWLRFLLARELPMACTLRLWDTYFASREGVELHLHVCLAVLSTYHDAWLDLTSAELLRVLQALPDIDIDQIIARATNLRFLDPRISPLRT
eukprot:TRINITY_DN2901_c0_g1_i2.p1 TRINITY_DN2901_c0_g1~~TRINITY_DN2901_c0_g1_i2.p1  ORF type:complete len:294 (-),score=77.64 TRINITY_DN2901_c0_g1_i2:34-855(-)